MTPLRTLDGVIAVREVYTRRAAVCEHGHDWVTLTIPLAGGFGAMSDIGEARICGAAAVLHPAGRVHAASVFPKGLEAIGIHFEPAWLTHAGLSIRLDQTRYWTGGAAGASARRLARIWMAGKASDARLAQLAVQFLDIAVRQTTTPRRPHWLDLIDSTLSIERSPQLSDLAREVDLHPAWLLQAYRAAKGEGLPEALRRKRVEFAIALLRGSDCTLADAAAQAGFCDQSHMNRVFRAVIGRTPLEVRADEREEISDGAAPY